MYNLDSIIEYITWKHLGQTRKYTGEPYISHCFSVAGIVAGIYSGNNILAAALLHDIVEDTDVTFDEIEFLTNSNVAELVYYVTDISRKEDGNRAVRKEIDRKHIASGNYWSKTIKLADLIDNSKSIALYDKNFAKVYMREKRQLLEVLSDGNKELFNIANNIVKDYYLQRLED